MAVGDVSIVEGDGAVPFKPVPATAPGTWTAADVQARREEWEYTFSPEEVQEIVEATKHAIATGKETPDLTQEDFPLPTLGPKLEQFRKNALFGLGFQLIHGFPVDLLDRKETVTAYWGIGTYWGDARVSQNAKGHVVGHVKNLGYKAGADEVRVYQTNAAQPWHKDGADIVTLLCLKTAKSGGTSGLASQNAIYNELLATHPEFVKVLSERFAFDRKGEIRPGQKPYWEVPVISWYKGYMSIFNAENHIYEAQRFPDVPRLTELQKEALKGIPAIANDPKFHIKMDLQPGDIQVVHNHTLLHWRSAFEDHEGWENRRHLLRLWINHPDARPVDPNLYSDSTENIKNGILPGTVKLAAPLEAE